ncbi:MAG: NAD(P)H-binding protein [Pseudomonadales bacterium]|nr:NAD(P)H-binding protein [Pseudomonadales bacterium]
MMKAPNSIAIVGATGKTGTRVLQRLQQLGYATRALSRQSEFAFDWSDRATWGPSLQGVTAAYVTYFPDLAMPQAADDMAAFVDVAQAEGVKHVVLLSGRGEEGAQRAEEVIKNSGLAWNLVRASWFMQNFSESFMLEGLQRGELVLPTPTATEPFIDVDDIADVVVAALTRTELRNQLLEITGPELLSFAHCVQVIAKASHREIGLQTLPIADYFASAKEEGLPDEMAWLINELFVHVLDGRNESTTTTVEAVLGRPARSFRHYVNHTAGTGIWASPVPLTATP